MSIVSLILLNGWMAFIHAELMMLKFLKHCELNFIGEHKNNYTNYDVEQVYFNTCIISQIPQGLTKVFPNLRSMCIDGSKLKEIKPEDLKEYDKLFKLKLPNNEIEYLLGDLFFNMRNLEEISLKHNKIKIIQPSIFDDLENLAIMDFRGNPCVDYDCFDECFCWNLSLDALKIVVNEKFSSPSWDLAFEKLRACDSGVCGDLKKIIRNEKLKDFTIKIGNEEFKVHKLLLAARSPVLAQIIENNIDAEELRLTDISREILCEILDFIYTDEHATFNDINYVKLFVAAGRLEIEKLKNCAAEELIHKINEENALEILTLANKYENDNLRQKSFEIIKKILTKDVAVADDLMHQPDKLSKLIEIQKKKEEFKRKTEEILKAIDLEFQATLA